MTAKKPTGKTSAEKTPTVKKAAPKKKTTTRRPKLDPAQPQRMASDPASSVWVTASAGTGKTKVLTDRVLRLMLSGSKPEELLCVTFTRAAASVMTIRIREELSSWATCDDKTLENKLKDLQGQQPDEATKKRARQLFAEFLDSHGGMRIQTIHSFSQSLLRRFPIESGIPPYFDVMDEQTAADMLRESQADVLRETQKDPTSPLARAVHMITPEVNEDDFAALIGQLTYRRGQLLSIFAEHGDMEQTIDEIYKYMEAPKGTDTRAMQQALVSDQGLNGRAPDMDALQEAADILTGGTATDLEKAKMIKAWILHPEERGDLLRDYASVFLTREGEVRKRLTTKGSAGAQHIMEVEAERIKAGLEEVSTMNVARGTESILRLTGAILERYGEKKRAANLLDYDDLVHHANMMMAEDNAASWVLQKLPGNLKHILIDEAQDTNPDQWRLVSSIAREFFTNPARKVSKDNTLFVVGDEKQSIFSFQRADPKEFATRKKFFEDLVKGAGGEWRQVEMDIAFRSSPAITSAVDAVFAQEDAADGLFCQEDQDTKKVHHDPFRRGQAGLIEVHPVVKAAPKEDLQPWAPPIKMEEVSDPPVELAEKIADQIKDWLDTGETLPSRKRAINPADIMILVRRRSAFVDHMVRALKKRDIPVAGADRMSLREQIVVMDLMALAEAALSPRDDYKLACVLKSPLIGMTDQQLEKLAVGRKGDLWTALKEKAESRKSDAVSKQAYEYLSDLREKLNVERPYEFYSSVLTNGCPADPKSGLYALFKRLGHEAEDPMVEFMNAVERFEKVHTPSLQGFLSWIRAGEAEVKREVNLNPEQPRVHIMTVHGAKGLEAPIVILPDTTGVPEDNTRARARFLWPDGDRKVPLWVPRADLENATFRRERLQAELEQDREYRRLLYVAMTRAADRLYVYGAQNSDRRSKKSWYSLIRNGLVEGMQGQLEVDGKLTPANDDKISAVAAAFDDASPAAKAATSKPMAAPASDEDTVLRHTVRQTGRAKPDGLKPAAKKKPVGIPVWAKNPPAADQRPVTKFRPSEYQSSNDNYSAASPLQGAGETYYKNLGTVIHQLFEFLPSLPAEEREEAAKKYLAKPVWEITPTDQAGSLKQVMSILADPEFGPLFGPNSRAEVSITGLFDRSGEKQMMSGQIDRLVVDDDTVTIIDFKNSRKVPKDVSGVSFKYVVQMASYRLALQQIYPDKEIKCALLYTRESKLIPISNGKLDKALEKIDLKPHVKSPTPPAPKASKGP